MKIISFGVILFLAIVISGLYLGFNGNLGQLGAFFHPQKKQQKVTLVYDGVENDESVMDPIISSFEKKYPNIIIKYSKESILNYRTRIQSQIRSGQGPDIFELHNSWVPLFKNDLSPAPSSVMSTSDFNQYYPVFSSSLVIGNNIYAVPLSLDGLVMYYNPDILKAADVTPPTTWQQFVEDAQKMTVVSQNGQIQTSGAAMGYTNNVNYWSDLIGLLFLQQPQGNLLQPANNNGVEVLTFYTSFINGQVKTWDSTLPPANQMFASGRLAFFFAPLSEYSTLKQINPNLNVDTAPVPQIPQRDVNWGRFWVEGVSRSSSHQLESWEFLKYLSSQSSLKLLNQDRINNHQLPYVYPYKDLASTQKKDPIIGSVVKQAGTYKNWFLNYNTQDAGINDEMIQLFATAIQNVNNGSDDLSELQSLQPKIISILNRYNLIQNSTAN